MIAAIVNLLSGVFVSAVGNKLTGGFKLPAELQGNKMPVITLSNGLKVGNFSSPHSFRFTDGNELPACSASRATLSALQPHEEIVSGLKSRHQDIKISFSLSEQTRWALREASKEDVDIILVPRIVLEALEKAGQDVRKTKFRTGRLADRVDKINRIDKFCV